MLKKAILETPILFLVFNRLDTTKKVFEEIRKAKPSRLFIASDGPRKNKEGEREIVEEVRKYILDNVDWNCKIKTLFRKQNLGCKYAVSGAIDWFFKNVQQGIILEDDCLPNKSFFKFCQELLNKYKDNKKIMQISGNNFLGQSLEDSYYFSKNAHIWGWATWKRAWAKHRLDLDKEEVYETINSLELNILQRKLILKRLRDTIERKNNTWDYQWQYALLKGGGMCVVPNVNLVENLGLKGSKFTNTKPNKIDLKFLYKKAGKLQFPLKHPLIIEKNDNFDRKELMLDIKRIILKKLF